MPMDASMLIFKKYAPDLIFQCLFFVLSVPSRTSSNDFKAFGTIPRNIKNMFQIEFPLSNSVYIRPGFKFNLLAVQATIWLKPEIDIVETRV